MPDAKLVSHVDRQFVIPFLDVQNSIEGKRRACIAYQADTAPFHKDVEIVGIEVHRSIWVGVFMRVVKRPGPGIVAASTIMTLPVVFLFLALERFLEQGLVAGGVKG